MRYKLCSEIPVFGRWGRGGRVCLWGWWMREEEEVVKMREGEQERNEIELYEVERL